MVANKVGGFHTFGLNHWFRSCLSLYGMNRLGSSLSVLDFVHLGSSLSLRGFARLGSSLSFYGMAHIPFEGIMARACSQLAARVPIHSNKGRVSTGKTVGKSCVVVNEAAPHIPHENLELNSACEYMA